MSYTNNDTKKGFCHCKAVEFEVEFHGNFEDLRRCNCSLCRKKGAIIASVPLEKLRVIKGEDNLSLYQWNSKVAKHFFCKICGIYTHHQRRSRPDLYGFNIACIEGVDPFAYSEISIGDGASQSLVPT